MTSSDASAQIPNHNTLLVQLADTPVEKLEELRQYSENQARFHQSYAAAVERVIRHRKRGQ